MLIGPGPRKVKEIEINGEKPFSKWLNKIKDTSAKAAILARITRISTVGNFGQYKYLDQGIFELKIDIGPGYRIYFGLKGDMMVLLILGGDKSTQQRDIHKAIQLWSLFLIDGKE